MEGNKDDADKCFQIGLKHFNSGNNKEALKFFNKAARLFPTERTQAFIDRLTKQKREEKENEDKNSNSKTKASMPGAHGTEGGAKYKKNPGSTEPTYTAEEIEAVKKIRGCKDYYEILELQKDCTDDELKKAYRKLALKFHPDKNQAPGATEAFKAISNAFSILSDPVKRRRYDEYGVETEHQSVSSHHHDYTHGFEADISAEDLFNAFFGGGLPRGQRATFRRTHFQNSNQANQERQEPRSVLLQYAPLIFFLVITIFSSLFAGQPSYSLQANSKYTVRRSTANLNVQYYVKPDFLEHYKSDLRRVEAQIEEEYIDNLKTNCYREKVYRENMMWQARYQSNSELYEHVKNIKTPSCDKLQDLY